MQVSPALPLRLDRPIACKALHSRFVPFQARSSSNSQRTNTAAVTNALGQGHSLQGRPGLHLLPRSRGHRIAASPPSSPDVPGESTYTSVKDSSPLSGSSLNGTPTFSSNGKQNGTGPLSASNSEYAVPSAANDAAPVAASGGFVPHRWRIVLMMATAFVLCNMDKVNMSVAVIPMAKDLGWSATERGLVSSSFFWGYSLTQVPAGYISTK
eukprot:GHUV01026092.1.p1 GENE.GHUV01026092.1~~GHUV01026092.1.p1  ORF type:complete len:211 (+),score=26.95 GHUV01026092.1:430-1062(+)